MFLNRSETFPRNRFNIAGSQVCEDAKKVTKLISELPHYTTASWRRELPSKLMLVSMDLEQFDFRVGDLWHLLTAQ